MRLAGGVILAVAVLSMSPQIAAQASPAPTHRVFLRSGEALPSYGEAAAVGDRVVFNLSIGGAGGPLALQLISLPVAEVDLERTSRYAETLRAAFYAATRGEADYAAMTAALSRDLRTLSGLDDRNRQVALAEEARRRLTAWPREHFHYRSGDVQKLVGLLGDLVNELKAAGGQPAFALELSAGPPAPMREAVLPAPGLRESIELALLAATRTDLSEDRVALLRVASSVVGGDRDLGALVARRLAEEVEATEAYAALAAGVRARARHAEARGDVAAVDHLEVELRTRDRQLGARRPAEVRQLVGEIRAARETARANRELLDRYATVRAALIEYELMVRPALSGLDGLKLVLEYVRDMRHVSYERTVVAHGRLVNFERLVARVVPPDALAAVHATLVSAVQMAREACERRRLAAVTNVARTLREASSAAAGALLLIDRSRHDLVQALCLGGRVPTCGRVQ